MQRIRLKFGRDSRLKFISHLDMMRAWQRVFNRAGLKLVYSEGFSPHPKFTIAAPLPVGVTSDAEFAEIFLEQPMTPHGVMAALSRELPPGLSLSQVFVVGLGEPSIQASLRHAEYAVKVEPEMGLDTVKASMDKLLGLETLSWEHRRDDQVKHYDLRALIDDVWLIESTAEYHVLGMRLRADVSGSGRPEQVTRALGFSQPPLDIHRTRLIMEQV